VSSTAETKGEKMLDGDGDDVELTPREKRRRRVAKDVEKSLLELDERVHCVEPALKANADARADGLLGDVDSDYEDEPVLSTPVRGMADGFYVFDENDPVHRLEMEKATQKRRRALETRAKMQQEKIAAMKSRVQRLKAMRRALNQRYFATFIVEPNPEAAAELEDRSNLMAERTGALAKFQAEYDALYQQFHRIDRRAPFQVHLADALIPRFATLTRDIKRWILAKNYDVRETARHDASKSHQAVAVEKLRQAIAAASSDNNDDNTKGQLQKELDDLLGARSLLEAQRAGDTLKVLRGEVAREGLELARLRHTAPIKIDETMGPTNDLESATLAVAKNINANNGRIDAEIERLDLAIMDAEDALRLDTDALKQMPPPPTGSASKMSMDDDDNDDDDPNAVAAKRAKATAARLFKPVSVLPVPPLITPASAVGARDGSAQREELDAELEEMEEYQRLLEQRMPDLDDAEEAELDRKYQRLSETIAVVTGVLGTLVRNDDRAAAEDAEFLRLDALKTELQQGFAELHGARREIGELRERIARWIAESYAFANNRDIRPTDAYRQLEERSDKVEETYRETLKKFTMYAETRTAIKQMLESATPSVSPSSSSSSASSPPDLLSQQIDRELALFEAARAEVVARAELRTTALQEFIEVHREGRKFLSSVRRNEVFAPNSDVSADVAEFDTRLQNLVRTTGDMDAINATLNARHGGMVRRLVDDLRALNTGNQRNRDAAMFRAVAQLRSEMEKENQADDFDQNDAFVKALKRAQQLATELTNMTGALYARMHAVPPPPPPSPPPQSSSSTPEDYVAEKARFETTRDSVLTLVRSDRAIASRMQILLAGHLFAQGRIAKTLKEARDWIKTARATNTPPTLETARQALEATYNEMLEKTQSVREQYLEATQKMSDQRDRARNEVLAMQEIVADNRLAMAVASDDKTASAKTPKTQAEWQQFNADIDEIRVRVMKHAQAFEAALQLFTNAALQATALGKGVVREYNEELIKKTAAVRAEFRAWVNVGSRRPPAVIQPMEPAELSNVPEPPPPPTPTP
jgi:hypothetical protein